MIRTVIRFANDMVAVFDRKGRQIPIYQGRYKEVRDKILADAPRDCIFETFKNGFGSMKVPRDAW